MTPLRIAIVEDEPACARRLELALRDVANIELVGAAADGPSGLDLVRSTGADLVFIDIRMPGLDGLQVAEALAGSGAPAVVFATAFADFAVSAFELGAVDYLLKPVETARVHAAVERARERLRTSTAREREAGLRLALGNLEARTPEPGGEGSAAHWLWVFDGRGRLRVRTSEVERFEAERDYVRIHTAGRAYLIRATLQSLDDRLDPELFARAHRSQIVNLSAVRGLRRRLSGAMVAVLQSGAEAPLGRAFLAGLKQRLGLKPQAAE